MGVAYQRGVLLYKQKRYAMAADEFRKDLSETPSSSLAMSMLALSLTYDDKKDSAIPIAESAIAADPERAFCHYALACTIIGRTPDWVVTGFFFRGVRLKYAIARYRRGLRKSKKPLLEA